MTYFSNLQFDSLRELQEHVGRYGGTILGIHTEAARHFICFEYVPVGRLPLHIGVVTFGSGITPKAVWISDRAIVGYNLFVAIIDECGKLAYEIETMSPFVDFLEVKDLDGCLIVLCESAVFCLTFDGFVKWRFDSDLITSYEIRRRSLCLTTDTDNVITIDVGSGRPYAGG